MTMRSPSKSRLSISSNFSLDLVLSILSLGKSNNYLFWSFHKNETVCLMKSLTTAPRRVLRRLGAGTPMASIRIVATAVSLAALLAPFSAAAQTSAPSAAKPQPGAVSRTLDASRGAVSIWVQQVTQKSNAGRASLFSLAGSAVYCPHWTQYSRPGPE